MTLSIGIAIFFTMWWIVLFAMLPIGVRSQHEEADYAQGTDPGAPVSPMILKKVIWTTGVTCVLFAALWAYMYYYP
jgi:predicted secreted protein